jgi:5'-nucleotidase
MRVLITNDDGIESPGLRVLAEMARARGHDVQVAAPCWDASGASSSVTGVSQTGERQVVTEPRTWDGWSDGSVVAVDATPALIVFYALHERLGQRPEVVLSGINRGPNTGRAILHSGTVGAAFTAYQQDCPGLAVSSGVLDMAGDAPVHWDTAATVAGQAFDWMTGWIAEGRRPVVLNCNVPDVPPEQLLGVRIGRLAIVGASQTSVTEEQGGSRGLTLGGEDESSEIESDAALVQAGYAAITAIRPVVEDTGVDLAAELGLSVGLGTPVTEAS